MEGGPPSGRFSAQIRPRGPPRSPGRRPAPTPSLGRRRARSARGRTARRPAPRRRGDAGARIGHDDLHLRPPGDGRHGDPSSGRGVADGVGEEVEEHLFDPPAVSPHRRKPRWKIDGEGDPGVLQVWLNQACDVLDQIAQETLSLRRVSWPASARASCWRSSMRRAVRWRRSLRADRFSGLGSRIPSSNPQRRSAGRRSGSGARGPRRR